ncbi:MAG: GNAT family N-acetyltransferase [Clostridia bacterium]|nr:GNAT family N-acetyltransferase [Clostridia bacterium]
MITKYPDNCDVGKLKSLWREAFGDTDEYINLFFNVAFSEERARITLIDGELAGALYWFGCEYDGGRVAYLYAVATAERYRGRGVCRALMEDTHAILSDLGYRAAVLVPGEAELFSMYGKMGYALLSGINEFSAYPSGRVVKIREITPDEYAKTRRRLLTFGGIIQERENMAFLSSLYKLYAADNLLFAAAVEKGKLFCPELLGDLSQAADIVSTLGCTEGEFRTPEAGKLFRSKPLGDVSQALDGGYAECEMRTPETGKLFRFEPLGDVSQALDGGYAECEMRTHGERRNFAMWRDLRDTGTPKPTYFGLAFD